MSQNPVPGIVSAAPLLRIDDLVKDFGASDGRRHTLAVDHVSLDIAQGEIFALLGSSGCGKTTLLRMLAGFETPTAGRILFAGQDISALPAYQRPFNMMFQSYALFPHLSVFDNIAFGLRRDRMPKPQVIERVEAMLKLVQLASFAKRKPHQLSGGQQQRVALARSLAKRPKLLLLDEPLGALDKKLREETQIELVKIVREVGVTCVMVTHDQEEAMTMASRIAVMSEGRVLQVGPPAEVYESPATRFVADFIGSVNLLEGRALEVDADSAVIDCGDCRLRIDAVPGLAAGAKVTIALRPEKIVLEPSPPPLGETTANGVAATVRDVAYFGSYTVYHLQLASGAVLKVSQGNLDRGLGGRLAPGDTAWARWAPVAPVLLTA